LQLIFAGSLFDLTGAKLEQLISSLDGVDLVDRNVFTLVKRHV
jgi:hypothetical protein